MELYRRIDRCFEHSDSRGNIHGLLNEGAWREMNLIASDAGAIRGGHYHKLTEECFVILSGAILATFRKPGANGLDSLEEVRFETGDVFIVNPLVEHTFEVREKARWINLLSIPMDAENPDFHRYSLAGS